MLQNCKPSTVLQYNTIIAFRNAEAWMKKWKSSSVSLCAHLSSPTHPPQTCCGVTMSHYVHLDVRARTLICTATEGRLSWTDTQQHAASELNGAVR